MHLPLPADDFFNNLVFYSFIFGKSYLVSSGFVSAHQKKGSKIPDSFIVRAEGTNIVCLAATDQLHVQQ